MYLIVLMLTGLSSEQVFELSFYSRIMFFQLQLWLFAVVSIFWETCIALSDFWFKFIYTSGAYVYYVLNFWILTGLSSDQVLHMGFYSRISTIVVICFCSFLSGSLHSFIRFWFIFLYLSGRVAYFSIYLLMLTCLSYVLLLNIGFYSIILCYFQRLWLLNH